MNSLHKNLVIMVAMLLGTSILGVMGVEVSGYFMIAAIVYFFVGGVFAIFFVRCPKCGKSLHMSKYAMRGIHSPFLPKECSSCGEKIE